MVASAHASDAFADGNVPDAYAVVSSLLHGIVESLVPPFTLSKFEGEIGLLDLKFVLHAGLSSTSSPARPNSSALRS